MFNLFSNGMFDVQCCDVHRGNEASFPLVLSDACSNFHPQLPPREALWKNKHYFGKFPVINVTSIWKKLSHRLQPEARGQFVVPSHLQKIVKPASTHLFFQTSGSLSRKLLCRPISLQEARGHAKDPGHLQKKLCQFAINYPSTRPMQLLQ